MDETMGVECNSLIYKEKDTSQGVLSVICLELEGELDIQGVATFEEDNGRAQINLAC